MKHRARHLLLVSAGLVPLLPAACTKDSPKATEPVEAAAAAPEGQPSSPASAAGSAPLAPPASASSSRSGIALAPKSTVKLLDPGREPLRTLRYAWHADQKESMAIELTTSVSAEGNGMHSNTAFAPLEIAIAVEPRSVSPSGDLSFAWHVVSAKVGITDASTPGPVAEGWAAQLVPVEHLSGTGIVSSTGISRGVSIDADSAGDAGPDAQMVVQVVQMLRDTAAPLPEEPVGIGAKWQKVSTLDAKTGHAIQTDTYTLSELAAGGSKGRLDDVLAQTASPQAAPAPEGMPGAPAPTVDQLLTSGVEKVHFDLGRLISQVTLDGTTSMALSAPSARMNMVMHLGITVRGTTP